MPHGLGCGKRSALRPRPPKRPRRRKQAAAGGCARQPPPPQRATARAASRWGYPLRNAQRARAEDAGGCVLGRRHYIYTTITARQSSLQVPKRSGQRPRPAHEQEHAAARSARAQLALHLGGSQRVNGSVLAQEGPAELIFPPKIFIGYIYCNYGAHEHLGGAFANFGSQVGFLCSDCAESDRID